MLNAALYLVKTFALLYLLTFVFRFILQWVRGDFHNPFSQFIVRVTNPLVIPARRIVPSVGEVDVPTLVVLVLLECIVTLLLVTMAGDSLAVDTFFLYVVLRLLSLILWFYSICIFVYVILSFVAQASYSPIAMLLGQVVGPVLRPVRRILPPIAGWDLSPLVVLIVLQAIMIALRLPAYLRY